MTTVQQAITETASAPLFEEFTKLINTKAAKLKKIQNIDLFEWGDKYGGDSANYKFREMHSLEYEIKVLIGIANFINDMSELQEQDINEVTASFEFKNELIQVMKDYIRTTLDIL